MGGTQTCGPTTRGTSSRSAARGPPDATARSSPTAPSPTTPGGWSGPTTTSTRPMFSKDGRRVVLTAEVTGTTSWTPRRSSQRGGWHADARTERIGRDGHSHGRAAEAPHASDADADPWRQWHRMTDTLTPRTPGPSSPPSYATVPRTFSAAHWHDRGRPGRARRPRDRRRHGRRRGRRLPRAPRPLARRRVVPQRRPRPPTRRRKGRPVFAYRRTDKRFPGQDVEIEGQLCLVEVP